MNDSDRRRLFDRWAGTYDDAVRSAAGFPFAGYDRVLNEIVLLADAGPGMRVLDLGTGTGNLAARFTALGCEVVGIDFSPGMLAAARRKVPEARFVRADLRGDPESLRGHRFDRIVSAYVFHEFDLATKTSLLGRLACDRLTEQGVIIIGDIAFPTVKGREEAHRRWAAEWDEEEHYWAADEAVAACTKAGLHVQYVQVSSCGGVFVIHKIKPTPMGNYKKNDLPSPMWM